MIKLNLQIVVVVHTLILHWISNVKYYHGSLLYVAATEIWFYNFTFTKLNL